MNLSQPRLLELKRGTFSYREGGDPDGRPVVMLHGWPESSWCWAPVTGYLKAGLRIIAIDLRGLGDSERTEGQDHYRKQELAQDVVQVLEALEVDRFQLVGHDWGGVVAQEVALAEPERVERLVIMNIAVINNLRGNQEVIRKVRAGSGRAYWYQHFQQTPGLPEAMIPGAEEAWLGYFLQTWNSAGFPGDAFDEYVRCYRIEGTPGAGANYYRTFTDDARRWASLGGHVWPMPSLYIYGNKDHVIIPEYLNHIEACFADVRVEEVEAGHFLQEEQPEAVAGYLNSFLEGATSPLPG